MNKLKQKLRYIMFSLSKKLFFNENKLIKGLSQELCNYISYEDLKIAIDNADLILEKENNLIVQNVLLPEYFSNRNIRYNNIWKNFKANYISVNDRFKCWYYHSKFKQKLPISFINYVDVLDKPTKLIDFKKLITNVRSINYHDGGRFNTLTKLDIYDENNNIVFEIDIIDNHNFYSNDDVYLGEITDTCITGSFDLYIGNNIKNKFRFFNHENWITLKIVNREKYKRSTTIDWLYLIRETLPQEFNININGDYKIKTIETGIEVYNSSGIYDLKYFVNLKEYD